MARITEAQIEEIADELVEIDVQCRGPTNEHVQACLNILDNIATNENIVPQENSINWGPHEDEGWYLSVRDEETSQEVCICCPDNQRIAEMEAEFD